MDSYQVDDAVGSGLFGMLLAEEPQTLAGVRCPRGVVVGVLGLLATQVAGERLGLHGL